MRIEITAKFYKRTALIDFITEIKNLAGSYSGPLTVKLDLNSNEPAKKGK